MKALAWHGTRDVRIDEVPEPTIQEPTDTVVRVTTTAICGSDLHLYEVLGAFLTEGDILGHEAMGIVDQVGSAVHHIAPGDRVVIPFNISCGHCWMCQRGLYAQCETTQVRSEGSGAALFGYTKLYGQVPGGQAELVRVPQAQFGPIKLPAEGPDERYVFLSDVLPTAWQAVQYAAIPDGGSVTVLGLGPIGQLCVRIARYHGASVIGVDPVPERRAMAQRYGAEVLDLGDGSGVADAIRDRTDGRGTDSVIDAVGMEAHGSPAGRLAQRVAAVLPDVAGRTLMRTAGVDRLAALYLAIDAVRRGGTISLSGVYGGAADPMPMLTLFDKGVRIAMGQAHVRQWTDTLLPLVTDEADPLGVMDLATHRLPLAEAPEAYDMFQHKRDGAIKVLLTP